MSISRSRDCIHSCCSGHSSSSSRNRDDCPFHRCSEAVGRSEVKRHTRVPSPWGYDMDEALRAQDAALRRQAALSPSSQWSSRSRLLFKLGVIAALALIWFLVYYALLSRDL